ncbi:MAG: carbohydrate porin [Nitrospirota bacterium]|nr:carbohydrate porin [Nitrospirota bacterium]
MEFRNFAVAVTLAAGLGLVSAPVAAAEAEESGRMANLEHLAESHHVEIGAGMTIVGQGADGPANADGGVTYSVDVALESEVGDLGTAFVYINTSQGTGLSFADALGNAVSPNGGFNADDEGGNVTDGGYGDSRVAEAWLKIPLGGEMAALTVGKVDATGIYDANEYANDETTQFLGDPFVNNMAITFPGYTLGASLEITPTDELTVNVGAFEAAGDFAGAMRGGVVIGEVAYAHDMMGGGNARFIYWQAEDTDAAAGTVLDESGFAVNFDQVVAEGAGVFLRYGVRDDNNATPGGIDSALSLGGQYELGTGVVGVGYSILTDAAATAGDDESQLEVYYSHEVSDSVHITADLQMMSSPEFNSANDDITVFGLRMQVDL